MGGTQQHSGVKSVGIRLGLLPRGSCCFATFSIYLQITLLAKGKACAVDLASHAMQTGQGGCILSAWGPRRQTLDDLLSLAATHACRYVFAGASSSTAGNTFNDLHRYDIASDSWTELTGTGGLFETRLGGLRCPYRHYWRPRSELRTVSG